MKGHFSNEVANLINREYGIEVADAPRRPTDLITDADLVEELLAHPGWELVQAVIDRLAEATLFTLDARSKPLDQAQYAQSHGFRNGMRVSADVAETYRQKAEKAVRAIEEAELASERT